MIENENLNPTNSQAVSYSVLENQKIFYKNGQQIAVQNLSSQGAIVVSTSGKIPDGITIEYYNTGIVKTRANYEDNQLNGILERYDSDGHILAEEKYQHGLLEGQVCIYYPQKNKIRETRYYKENKLDGKREIFYSNGKKSLEEIYEKGKLNGLKQVFYENGNLNLKEIYVNDKLESEKSYYYQDGSLWYKENYSNGKLEGEKLTYYPNKKLFIKENFKDGMLQGEKLTYDENSELKSRENYDRNQLVNEDKNGK